MAINPVLIYGFARAITQRMGKMSHQTKGVLALAGLALSYAVLVLHPIWRGLSQACYHYYDFGIYADALARLNVHNLNPYVPMRHLRIFNDHADPILWLGKIWMPWYSAAEAGILTEASVVLAQLIPLGYLVHRRLLLPSAAVLLGSLLLFNPGLLSSVYFPFHPTTWAVLPMTWLMVALSLESTWGASVALVALFCCKEEFFFVGLMLSAASCAARRWRLACLCACMSLAWAALVFGLRPMALGSTSAYATTLFTGLGDAPLSWFWARLTVHGMWSRISSCVVCFLPALVYVYREKRALWWTAVWMSVPLIAIRFCGMAWRHHYSACVVACLVGALYRPLFQMRVPVWVTAATIALLIGTGTNSLRTGVYMLRESRNQAPAHCPKDPERIQAIDEGVRFLLAHPNKRALVGQSLAPLVSDRDQTEVAEGDADAAGTTWQYVFFEASVPGRTLPAGQITPNAWMQLCRQHPQARVLIDRAGVFLAEQCPW